jgi:hypothetical protein
MARFEVLRILTFALGQTGEHCEKLVSTSGLHTEKCNSNSILIHAIWQRFWTELTPILVHAEKWYIS